MKYEVEITRKILYNFSVEADNEEDAEVEAYDLYEKAFESGTFPDFKYDEDILIDVGNPIEE